MAARKVNCGTGPAVLDKEGIRPAEGMTRRQMETVINFSLLPY